jgi:lipoprotein-anchoring transpeptidase ErfK/SrfK
MKNHIGVHYINRPKHLVLTLALIVGGILGITFSIRAYPQVFNTEIRLNKTKNVGFSDTLEILFSQPMLTNNYTPEIKVARKISEKKYVNEGINMQWTDSNKKLLITPQYFWKPESEYAIVLPGGRNIMMTGVESQYFTFETLPYPRVSKVFPENNSKDVVVEIEDPITVDFNQTTENFSVDFRIEPKTDITFQSNPEKTQYKILPKDSLKQGTDYKLKIYVKHEKDASENSKFIFESDFSTLPPSPQQWEKDFTLRLEQAKKFTKAKKETGKYIDINLAVQILSLFEDGKLLDSYLISSGKRGMDTPKGEFKVMAKRPRPWSNKYGLYMPWFMQFTGEGHGIHELPEWPGGYKEGANHLGIPVSHGCVRLGIGPAKRAYDWAEVGTPIVIY